MALSLLVGSLNLEDADTVFAVTSEHLGPELARIPDGETGARLLWVSSLEGRIAAVDGLEEASSWGEGLEVELHFPLFRPRADVKPEDVAFGNLGYADDAIASYERFRLALERGVVRPGTRFQVSLPTAYMALMAYIEQPYRDLLYPAYENALASEIARVLEVIPAAQLAVQWDIPCEVGITEGVDPRNPWTLHDAAKQLGRMAALVPAGVELGFHHCYGDPPDPETGHGKHWMQPRDAGAMVRLSNATIEFVHRPVTWMHMPVPVERTDDAYFEPLADLTVPDGCELYLGLVHLEDGVEGSQARARVAARHTTFAGVATECGLGRIPRDEVVPTLELHRALELPF